MQAAIPLPDDLWLEILSLLPVEQRRATSLVCRRWRQLADHPSLLGSISVAFEGEGWVQQYAAFADWLPPRAPHLRDLSVCAAGFAGETPVQPRPPTEEEDGRAAAATAAVLTACTAASQLTRLWMELGCEFQQAGLLPALRTLHDLDIRTARVVHDQLREATFDASLTALTALAQLHLGGFPTELPASTLLPPTLTKLRLSCCNGPAMPVQLRALPCLHSLCLYGMPHAAGGYGALTAVSSLRSLSLFNCVALPACLPQLSGLEALCISDPAGLVDHSEGEPAAMLAAALPHLTALTHLALVAERQAADGPFGPSPLIPVVLPLLAGRSQLHSLLLAADTPAGLQLPAGLPGLRQLAAPAQLLAASLPALAPVTRLQLLCLLRCNDVQDADRLGHLLWWAVQLPVVDTLLLEANGPLGEDLDEAIREGFAVHWLKCQQTFRAELKCQQEGTQPANPHYAVLEDALKRREVRGMAGQLD